MGFDKFLFGDPTLSFLKRSMDVQQFRTEVIAGNLANVDTPGYKSMDVDFARALEDARGMVSGELNLERTNVRHIGTSDSEFPTEVKEEVDKGSIRVDGNTVNQDEELQKLADSQMYYTASITAITKKLKAISEAITPKI
ncbi:MAG: flagellar basal body rod protein FlgB [Myxococcales bacterium]|nr:flagellar basal body rod protein FlgB [Myxococcales bacterium]